MHRDCLCTHSKFVKLQHFIIGWLWLTAVASGQTLNATTLNAGNLVVGGDTPFPGTTFYVNTDTGTGSGVGSLADPFDSLREAITHANLDIADERLIECSGAAADTLSVTQTQWNSISTTPETYLLIRGNNTTPGIYNTGCYRLEVSGGNVIYNNQPGHVRIDNLQVKLSSGSGLTAYRLSTANVGIGRTDCDCRIYNSIAWCPDGGNACTNSEYAEGISPTAGTMRIWNFVSIGGDMTSVNAGVENYNCTIYGATDGFEDAQIIVNCISVGNANLDYTNVGTGGGVSNYNVDEDNTAPGANSVTGTPSFVSAGTDLHLQSGDTVAKNAGTSNPASGLFLDDIDGQTRSGSWDIGADEQQ